jgi:hypothetical protein
MCQGASAPCNNVVGMRKQGLREMAHGQGTRYTYCGSYIVVAARGRGEQLCQGYMPPAPHTCFSTVVQARWEARMASGGPPTLPHARDVAAAPTRARTRPYSHVTQMVPR